MNKLKLISILFLVLPLSILAHNRQKPALVVQVVVDGMRYDNFVRYSKNYSQDGLGKLANEGTQFRNARLESTASYPFVGMASLLTGATPSQHGIVAQNWVNYTTNSVVDMFQDNDWVGVGTRIERGAYSPKNILVQTVGDLLRSLSDSSKVISIGFDHRNAIVAGGSNPYSVFWLDTLNMWWSSNSYYMNMLPKWAENFNKSDFKKALCNKGWNSAFTQEKYINTKSSDLFKKNGLLNNLFKATVVEYSTIHATPLVDDYLYETARQAIINENLGTDKFPDLLTLSFSALSQVNSKYGISSCEAEDVYYNLDRIMADLNNLLTLKCGKGNYVIVFTGSCGTSNDIQEGKRVKAGKFNKLQFKVMMNSFLAAQFGVYDLILSYDRGNLFLNRKLIFEKQLSLSEVREKCATFAQQFKGVAHTYTADALRYMSQDRGVESRVVNSFYPKYSGDVVVVLLPNWFEVDLEESKDISSYGSAYDYDVHVPLIFYGKNILKRNVVRDVSIIDVAPTITELLKIGRTDVSQGSALEEIVSMSVN